MNVGNLVDSRYKQNADGFQHQIDELKLKVSNIEAKEIHNEIQKQDISGRLTNINACSLCQSSTSLCTFHFPDHPDASG